MERTAAGSKPLAAAAARAERIYEYSMRRLSSRQRTPVSPGFRLTQGGVEHISGWKAFRSQFQATLGSRGEH